MRVLPKALGALFLCQFCDGKVSLFEDLNQKSLRGLDSLDTAILEDAPISMSSGEVQEFKVDTRRLAGCNSNLIQNSDGLSSGSGDNLHQWLGMRCTLTSIEDSYKPESKGFKVENRFDENAGMSQFLTEESIDCLNLGDTVTFSMYLKLEDENGDPFACDFSPWNQPGTCPLLSFRIQRQDFSQTWYNAMNTVNLAASGGWIADEWNEYKVSFAVTADFAYANGIYFTIRGPAQPISILLSDPVFSIDGAPTPSPIVSIASSSPTPAPTSFPTSILTDVPTDQPTSAPVLTLSPPPSLRSPPTASPTKYEPKDSRESITATPTITNVSMASDNFDPGDSTNDSCDLGVNTESFAEGPWTVHTYRGTLDYYDASSLGGSSQAIKVSERTSIHAGPQHPLNGDCFVLERVIEIQAFINLVDASTETGYVCDPLAGPESTCPILTMEMSYVDGSSSYVYAANEAAETWDADGLNEYKGYFSITDEMISADSIIFYFEKPPVGVDIILDGVEVREFQPVSVGNLHIEGDDYVYADCAEIVTNGDAEMADTSGWTPRLGGHLSVRPEGADGTNFSFEHGARTSFIMGPKHALKTHCFIEGLRYAFDAKLKLLDDNGTPITCDKSHSWIDEQSCPLLTFQLEDANGDKTWKYYGNEHPAPWDASIWNSFNTFFTITNDIATASDAYFYVERPRAGISIVIDEVVISRDCTQLIANSDAENGSLAGWSVKSGAGGNIVIYPEGADGSLHSYGHFNRTSNGGGPSHMLDLGCLVLGRQYEFTAKYKLLDELDENAPFACRNDVEWGDPLLCPLFSITMVDSNGDLRDAMNFLNTDPSTVMADQFNRYQAIFTVTEDMANAQEARIIIKGPRPGIATLLDDIELKLYEPPEYDCSEVVPNGDFEDGDYFRWGIRQTGSLQLYDDGADDSEKSLLIVDRTMPGAGFKFDFNSSCLVEGRRYEFSAMMKLLTEQGEPFNCTKSAGYADPKACPLLSFEFVTNGTNYISHFADEDPSQFASDTWNVYNRIFTVTHELANAESADLLIHGPAAGIGIAIDKVSLNEYVSPHIDCNQLVINGNAESNSLTGWKVNHGGYISIIENGGESNHAFIQTDRTQNYFGPKQDIPLSCLTVEGDEYVMSAKFKLLDSDNNPLACDKSVPWGNALTCPLLSIEVIHPIDGIKRTHYYNLNTSAPTADEWNQYDAVVRVNENMVVAEKAFFYFQGPAAGVSIVFDNVSLTPAQPPSA